MGHLRYRAHGLRQGEKLCDFLGVLRRSIAQTSGYPSAPRVIWHAASIAGIEEKHILHPETAPLESTEFTYRTDGSLAFVRTNNLHDEVER